MFRLNKQITNGSDIKIKKHASTFFETKIIHNKTLCETLNIKPLYIDKYLHLYNWSIILFLLDS